MGSSLDLNSLPVLPLLVIAGIAFVATIVIYGYSMKWGLSLAGCGKHGFGWSFCISFAAGVTSSVAVVACGIVSEAIPPYLPLLISFVVAVLTVSAMSKSNPFSAGLAYFLSLLIGGVGMVMLIAGIVAASMAFVDYREIATAMQAMQPGMQSLSHSEEDEWAVSNETFDNVFFEDSDAVREVNADGANAVNWLQQARQSANEAWAARTADSDTESEHQGSYESVGDENSTHPAKPRNSVQTNPFVK
ncbi:hypothetical protein LOC70_19535 [Rhodopirellula sp. JC737]|nr:hypothetical protein [Rhodopirellula sp. JC737]